MSRRPRPRRVQVKLSQLEFEQLDARATAVGVTRSAFVRQALREVGDEGPPVGRVAVLDRLARDGSTAALIALSRELRLAPVAPVVPVVTPATAEAEQRADELASLRSLHSKPERTRR